VWPEEWPEGNGGSRWAAGTLSEGPLEALAARFTVACCFLVGFTSCDRSPPEEFDEPFFEEPDPPAHPRISPSTPHEPELGVVVVVVVGDGVDVGGALLGVVLGAVPLAGADGALDGVPMLPI
jgi:hypothetical protein